MTEEEKEMMNVMGFFAFSTTKVRRVVFLSIYWVTCLDAVDWTEKASYLSPAAT